MTKLMDISPQINGEIEVWPGDTRFQMSWVTRMDQGASCNVASLTTTVHLGSHADGPLHFQQDGQGIGELDLDPYLGRCRVVDVTGSLIIDDDSVFGLELAGADRLLFKTGTFPDFRSFNEDFACFDPGFVRRLGKMGVKLIGIDTPSVDAFDSKDLPSHHMLLEMGMRNLEGLDLSRVDPGVYELIALPLRLTEADSSPVRAVLRTLE